MLLELRDHPRFTASLQSVVAAVIPGALVTSIAPIPRDPAARDATQKAAGYGAPLRVAVRHPDGREGMLVFHTESPNDFGHDRRSDRAANTLLAFDTFRGLDAHVQALDVGAIAADGSLRSLRDVGEFYLLTTYAEGRLYADDLRRIVDSAQAETIDLQRCDALVDYLIELHAQRGSRPAVYVRHVRDLVGHGEGIFGLIDGYPEGVAAAPPERLKRIEQCCVEWRWRLRGREGRLRRTHGDFHPFNVVFDEDARPTLLDTSRGGYGDPADDVACMALNYVFFALQRPVSWPAGHGVLWRRFWRRYLDGTGDWGVLDVAPPFLAWRALVMANPVWYPSIDADVRDRLLGFVERVLRAAGFDPAWSEELFV